MKGFFQLMENKAVNSGRNIVFVYIFNILFALNYSVELYYLAI